MQGCRPYLLYLEDWQQAKNCKVPFHPDFFASVLICKMALIERARIYPAFLYMYTYDDIASGK